MITYLILEQQRHVDILDVLWVTDRSRICVRAADFGVLRNKLGITDSDLTAQLPADVGRWRASALSCVVASPVAQPADPAPAAMRPPVADPVAIRACLTPDVAAVFDAEWKVVLEEAKQSKHLAGVRELLQHWRHFAHQELREPGSYFRVMATAARTQATRQAPAGRVSCEEIRARVEARLAEVGLNEAERR